MTEPFTFYRALDPVKGSWDGYGFHRSGEVDFLAFVTDAPSAASIHTPEIIADFWTKYVRENLEASADPDVARFELADGINRLHNFLQRKSRLDGSGYQATLSIARKIGNQLLYCSIGDSMLQLFRNGVLYRLNNSEVWDGSIIIKESQHLTERQKTEMLRFVGDGGDFVGASGILHITLRSGDCLVFSTDGVEDLLAPDRLIPILQKPEAMREEFERIFAQERLRDDITFLAIDINAPAAFEAEKEISTVCSSIEALRKEQSEFRNDLSRVAMPSARLERIEKNLMAVAQQIQTINKKLETIGKTNRMEGSYTIARPASRASAYRFWLWIATSAAVALLAATGFLLWTRPRIIAQTPQPSSAQPRHESARAVSPPDISSTTQECEYAVEKGDSLEKIALKKKVDMDSILRLNPTLKRTTGLRVGERILLCEKN